MSKDDAPIARSQRLRGLYVITLLVLEKLGAHQTRNRRPGDDRDGEHDEIGQGAGRHEEVYVVLFGSARFTLDGVDVVGLASGLGSAWFRIGALKLFADGADLQPVGVIPYPRIYEDSAKYTLTIHVKQPFEYHVGMSVPYAP